MVVAMRPNSYLLRGACGSAICRAPILPLALAGGLSVLAGTACHRAETAQESADVTAIRVEAVTVDDEVAVSGTIEAVERVQTGFMVAGRVQAVDVKDGAAVMQGDLLAELDPSDYQQQLAIANARLAEVSSRYGRLKRLREVGSLTATDFDQITSALAQAESAAELARRQLDYTKLRAPFAGWVVKGPIESGTVVAPGAPVFTILSPSPAWAAVGVPEAEATRVRLGQEASVYLSAVGDHPYAGVVDAILPQADPLTRTFPVKIRVANSDRALRPGNVITARIRTGGRRLAVALPAQAVHRYADGTLYVWTVDSAHGTAARRIIQVGALLATRVEILSGVKPGDLVVVDSPATLFEGLQLNVAPAP